MRKCPRRLLQPLPFRLSSRSSEKSGGTPRTPDSRISPKLIFCERPVTAISHLGGPFAGGTEQVGPISPQGTKALAATFKRVRPRLPPTK